MTVAMGRLSTDAEALGCPGGILVALLGSWIEIGPSRGVARIGPADAQALSVASRSTSCG